MKKKWYAAFYLLLVVALILAACAPSTPEAEPPAEEEEVAEEPAEEEAEAEAEEEDAEEAEEEAAEEPEALPEVSVDFTGWTYDLEKVMDNLENYKAWVATEAELKAQVEIAWTDSGFGEFDTHVTTVNAAGNTFDVLYGSDHWLAKWAAAGWVLPLEDYWPEIKDYEADIAPYSVTAMTYDGKLYGLPYYTDVMYFFYNTKMLEDAGIAAPPTTWAEVTEQGLTLKEQGVTDTPVMFGLAASSWLDEVLYALIYSEGGDLFDEDMNAVFDTSSGAFYDVIEWLSAALLDDQIMPQSVLEMTAVDVQEAFKAGDCAFVIVPGYMVREFNTEGVSSVAGYAEVAMMPGSTHETNGYSRMYLLGAGAVEDEDTLNASINLIEFLGGETTFEGETAYHVAKRWAVENGLGFSVLSLWDDPDVDAAFANMADTTIMQEQKEIALSKQGMGAPWFPEWITFVRTEVQKAILDQVTTEEALESIKLQWEALKAE
jgi:multiple sugar transport system substrate-binding protein